VQDVAFSDDSRTITSLGSVDLKQWNAADGRELRTAMLIAEKDRVLLNGQQTQTALTRNGGLAALAGGATFGGGVLGFGAGVRARPVRIIETATGRDLDTFKPQGDFPIAMRLLFSPDGRFLVSAVMQATGRTGPQIDVTVYELATGRVTKTLPPDNGLAGFSVAFNAESTILAVRHSPGFATAPGRPGRRFRFRPTRQPRSVTCVAPRSPSTMCARGRLFASWPTREPIH
jgi:hypothetical protein